MTTHNDLTYGWEIEGFGTYYEWALGRALRLSYVSMPSAAGGDSIWAKGMVGFPKTVSTTSEVLIGSTTQSTLQIMIGHFDKTDQPGEMYGRLALRYLWQSRPVVVAWQTVAMGAGDTDLYIKEVAGEEAIVAGDLIYLGREVMVVNSVSGSSPNIILDVARGALGSDAVAHDLADIEIFKSNSVNLDRRVCFVEYDNRNDTEVVRWRGVIEDIEMADDTLVLCVTCRSMGGIISKRRIVKDRWEGVVGVRRMSTVSNSSGDAELFVTVPSREGETVVDYKPLYPDVPPGFIPGTERYADLGITGIKAMCIEVDGQAIAIRASEVTTLTPGYRAGYQHALENGFARQIDGGEFKAEYESKDFKAAEILVVDADSPLSLFRDANGTKSDHPAIVILCILTSTGTAVWPTGGSHTVGINGDYDWLPKPFGRAVPIDWIDETAFDLLQREYPTAGLRARAAYIGAGKFKSDGSTMDMLADFAQAMGCFLYEDGEARISIKRLADPGFGRTDHTVTAATLAARKNQGEGQAKTTHTPIYQIAMEVAQKGPKGEPGHMVYAGGLNQARVSRALYFAVKDKLDSTLIYGDPELARLNGVERQQLVDAFRWRYAYLVDNLPQYRGRLVEGSDRVVAGEFINLSHPYYFNNSDMVRGFTSHRCLVLDAKWEPDTGTQEVVIADFTPASGANTLITPSWRVQSVTSSTQFVLADDYFKPSGDRAKFVAGATYLVTLWTADGQLRSSSGAGATRYASTFNSGTGAVVLVGAFTNGGGSITPAVGDIIRVANYDSAVGWQAQGYTWLGDSNMELGAANISAGRWDV